MKKLAIALLLFTVSLSVCAEEGVKRETVEQLLEVMQAEKMVDATYGQMDQLFANISRDLGIKESEKEIFDRFISKVIDAMKQEITWAKMKEPLIAIYMKHYTQKEIEDVMAFYSTDSGKAMIKKMPVVMQESMMISQSMLKGFMPKVRELSIELHRELELARNSEANPPAATPDAKGQ